MKTLTNILLATTLGLGLWQGAATAASKTYQVTGQVLEVTDAAVTVETAKGKEKWQIDRDAATKAKGDAPKVGDKVLIEYKMTATSIENKGGDAKAAKKK